MVKIATDSLIQNLNHSGCLYTEKSMCISSWKSSKWVSVDLNQDHLSSHNLCKFVINHIFYASFSSDIFSNCIFWCVEHFWNSCNMGTIQHTCFKVENYHQNWNVFNIKGMVFGLKTLHCVWLSNSNKVLCSVNMNS